MADCLNFFDVGAQNDTSLHNSRLAPSGGHRPRRLPYGARRLSDSRAWRGHHQPGFWLDGPGKSPLSSPVPEVTGPAHLKKLPEIVAWTRDIQTQAAQLAAQDSFPIFIGGDHSMAAGTLTGVAQAAADRGRPQFVLWLDAHPDMNTLTSSLSGHLHGTPMAYALGLPSFEGIFPPVPAPLDPANICMMGLRSVDEAEHRFIAEMGIDVYDMRRIDELGVVKPMEAFLAAVWPRPTAFCM